MRASVSVVALLLSCGLAVFSGAHAAAAHSTGTRPTVWSLYSVWHAYAAQTVLNQTFSPITVEDVIRSDGNLTLGDIYRPAHNRAAAHSFYYQYEPAEGPYCIYKKRPGDADPPLPDCANINETLRRHADILTETGVDSIIVDATNLGSFAPFSDVIQVRPVEVLLEGWADLRRRGVATPTLAVWNCVPPGSNVWEHFMPLFAAYPDLMAKCPRTGKYVFFVPTSQAVDPTIVAAIESNGGRNDVIVQRMWTFFPKADFDSEWAFFSSCIDPATGQYVSSVASITECNQYVTTNSTLGSVATVSASYQLDYGSLPFGAAGQVGVRTLQMQFKSALAKLPDADNILLSSFNEILAQPQPNPYAAQSEYVRSMGLEWDPAARTELFVDTFGCDFARDYGPSRECGNRSLAMVQSCLRVWTLARSSEFRARHGSRAATHACDFIDGEACCTVAEQDERRPVWAFRRTDGSDFLLSVEPAEVAVLNSSPLWVQVCAYKNGATTFCSDASVMPTRWAVSGPFYTAIHKSDPRDQMLYRCLEGGVHHFFTTDPHCEGQGTPEQEIGYLQAARSGYFPRSFRRCFDTATGVHYHSLDFACPAGHEEAMYGFVL